ncbi:hypothetical protein RRG08_029826 [Elysia crispata]|uniref:Uncharacterized protein n=1 Tax=Elysia crispata TaxID=231223 RepID=A0AAE0YM56_9GAST|nr:hypothetical protein RRG08_029826 [Elysia crispata]
MTRICQCCQSIHYPKKSMYALTGLIKETSYLDTVLSRQTLWSSAIDRGGGRKMQAMSADCSALHVMNGNLHDLRGVWLYSLYNRLFGLVVITNFSVLSS